MRTAAFAFAAASLVGCGGGSPLLHPARTLPRGEVRAAAGMSAEFATGDLSSAIAAARERAAVNPEVPGPPGSDPTYARGALVAAAVAPGMAPFVSARVGVGNAFEGGITYTGRGARVDLRRSFVLSPETDFSIGAGAGAPFYGGDSGSLPNVDLGKLRGYGFDVPILFGWESSAGIYKAWAGARGGYERVALENVSSDPRPGVPSPGIPLDADHVWVGPVLGVAVGFRHVHVGLELQASYVWLTGSYNGNNASLSGIALTPATALSWEF